LDWAFSSLRQLLFSEVRNVEALASLLSREHQQHRQASVAEGQGAGGRERQRRAFLRNNVLQGTRASSHAGPLSMVFIAVRATALIFAAASRAGQTFCARK